jgi:hypothetical protein
VYYFDTQTPYFFIDFEGGIECEMDELVVLFRYEQYGVEALDMMEAFKSEKIETKRLEVNRPDDKISKAIMLILDPLRLLKVVRHRLFS